MQYAVIQERIMAYRRYHIIPADQYRQERAEGDWSHPSFESVRFFDSLKEAEEYVRQETDFYVCAYCVPLQDYCIVHYDDAENIYTQPNTYEIIHEGSFEECEKLLEELEKEEM